MKNSSTSALPNFKRLLKMSRLETGFSMLEAVVVVGVLLALAVGGFFAYGPITENAKIAKVKSAASEVHTGVLVASMDGNSDTTPEKVIDDWNNSVDNIKVALVDSQGGNGDFCVSATNVSSPNITHQTGSCAPGSPGSDPGADGASEADPLTVTGPSSISPVIITGFNAEIKAYKDPAYIAAWSGAPEGDAYWESDVYLAYDETAQSIFKDFSLTVERNNILYSTVPAVQSARAAYYDALDAFDAALTEATQNTMVEKLHDYYQTAANTEVPDFAVKAASDSSLSHTVTSGSTEPVKYRLILPDGAIPNTTLMEVHESTDWLTPTSNIGEKLNLTITYSNDPVGVDANGKQYWELTFTPKDGGFAAGSESAAVKFSHIQDWSWESNPLYYTEITLTVQ